MTQSEPILVPVSDCPVCNSPCFDLERSGPDYFMHQPGTFTLVRCDGCSTLFQNPRPSLHDINRYYPDSYGSYAKAEAGIKGQRGLMRRVIQRGQQQRTCILAHLLPASSEHPRRLLDVGCAAGLFLEAMQSYSGWQVEGVELNASAAHATSERLGIPVFAGPFEHARYPDASFDAVTLWDVLEHFHDPLTSLRELRRIIKPGGVVFIRTPNAASYVARLCGRYWSGYDLPRHMTIFDANTLDLALARAGFSTPVIMYTSGSYLAALHSLRWALDDRRSPLAARVHRVLYHPLMRLLLRAPFVLADRVAGGSNLEVVAIAR